MIKYIFTYQISLGYALIYNITEVVTHINTAQRVFLGCLYKIAEMTCNIRQ